MKKATGDEIERIETVMELLAMNVARVNAVRVMELLPAHAPVASIRSFFDAVTRLQSHKQRDLQVYNPDLRYCTDNAAMIAYMGYWQSTLGPGSNLDIQAYPNLKLSFGAG